MTWSNPSAMLVQWRTQLLASSTVVGLGAVTGSFHYPAASLGDVDGQTVDARPAIVLAETSTTRNRYAVGAQPIMSGTLRATFYLDVDDVGAIETAARSIVDDLSLQQPGIPFSSFRVSLGSNPQQGERATEDVNDVDSADTIPPASAPFFAIQIEADYGLNA